MSDKPNPEIWRPIPGYEGYYEFSSRKRCRAVRRTVAPKVGAPRVVGPCLLRRGTAGQSKLPVFRLCRDGDSRSHYVSSLFRLTFPELAALEPPKPRKSPVRVRRMVSRIKRKLAAQSKETPKDRSPWE